MSLNPEERIRQLQDYLSRIYHYLKSEAEAPEQDHMQAGLLARLLECVILDTHRRRIVKRDGTLAEWAEVTIGIQYAHLLLAQVRRDETEELKGWRLEQPRNEAQEVYSFLYGILLELGQSAVEIEDRLPHLQHSFDDAREEQFSAPQATRLE